MSMTTSGRNRATVHALDEIFSRTGIVDAYVIQQIFRNNGLAIVETTETTDQNEKSEEAMNELARSLRNQVRSDLLDPSNVRMVRERFSEAPFEAVSVEDIDGVLDSLWEE